MKQRLFSLLLCAVFMAGLAPVSSAMEEDNVIWQVRPREGNYMKYFGKRVVDVNRADSDRLVLRNSAGRGNQLIFIFHLTSKQLQVPVFEFTFEIISKDYDSDELVELDIYAGTNINNLKTVAQKIKIDHSGFYKLSIPSTQFYLGSQNFIKVLDRMYGRLVMEKIRRIAGLDRLSFLIPGENSKQEEEQKAETSAPQEQKKAAAPVVSLGPQTAVLPASKPAEAEISSGAETAPSETPAQAPSEPVQTK